MAERPARSSASAAFVASMVGRVTIAMTPLAMALAFSARFDSVASGGLAVGGFAAANVIASPARGRLLDARNRRTVLIFLALCFTTCLLVTSGAISDGNLTVALCFVCIAGVAQPPVGPIMRVVWREVTNSPHALLRAYSIDATASELCYAVAPLLVVFLASVVAPEHALIAICVPCLFGVGAFALTAPQRPAPEPSTPSGNRRWTVTAPAFPSILVLTLGLGVIAGSIEISAVAIGDDEANLFLTGLLVTGFSMGSVVGCLMVGRRRPIDQPHRRLPVLASILAILCTTGYLITPTFPLLVALVAAGALLGPCLILGYVATDRLSNGHNGVAFNSWLGAAFNLGTALGTSTGGLAVEADRPQSPLLVGGLLALVCVAVSISRSNRRANGY